MGVVFVVLWWTSNALMIGKGLSFLSGTSIFVFHHKYLGDVLRRRNGAVARGCLFDLFLSGMYVFQYLLAQAIFVNLLFAK